MDLKPLAEPDVTLALDDRTLAAKTINTVDRSGFAPVIWAGELETPPGRETCTG